VTSQIEEDSLKLLRNYICDRLKFDEFLTPRDEILHVDETVQNNHQVVNGEEKKPRSDLTGRTREIFSSENVLEEEIILKRRNHVLIERFLDLDHPKLSDRMIYFLKEEGVMEILMSYLTQHSPDFLSNETCFDDVKSAKRSLHLVNILCSQTPASKKLIGFEFERICKLISSSFSFIFTYNYLFWFF
jgi:hypothetical protein